MNSLHLHVNALRSRTGQNRQETRSLSLQEFNRSRWQIDARELLELIASRRSCRAFDGSEIDPETLREIVIDGTQAPSSCNQQQWHFVIVTDRADLVRACEIAGGNPLRRMLGADLPLLSERMGA